MSKHEKQDDKDRYDKNGYDPDRPIPGKDPGGKHEKNDKGNEDKDEKK